MYSKYIMVLKIIEFRIFLVVTSICSSMLRSRKKLLFDTTMLINEIIFMPSGRYNI